MIYPRLETSSISKKVIMAIAGLFLVTFLLVHLTINLMLLLPDGGELFTKSAEFMTKNPVIKVFEVVLFGGFIIHMFYGLLITLHNWLSRPIKYKRISRTKTSFFSRYMFHTGVIIAIFLLIHFANFYFVKLGWVAPPKGVEKHNFYQMVILLFTDKLYSWAYIAFLALLGFHLNHAFHSAFQTLGLNHNKYTPAIKLIATLYAVLVSAGFIIIPVYFMYFY